jgi:hypothetical protein
MKKEEKLTENIIAILELNKRKWDEEHPSKHDENTIKNLVDKHNDVPKKSEKHKAKLVNKYKDASKEKHDFPKFEKELKKDKLSIVSFRLPIALKETIDYYCKEKGMNRTDYFHGFLSEFKTISLELFELKKLLQEKEKENKEKDSKSVAESEYSSSGYCEFNSKFFNSENESKSKNIVLNISSSINLNVSNLNSKETISLTINVS